MPSYGVNGAFCAGGASRHQAELELHAKEAKRRMLHLNHYRSPERLMNGEPPSRTLPNSPLRATGSASLESASYLGHQGGSGAQSQHGLTQLERRVGSLENWLMDAANSSSNSASTSTAACSGVPTRMQHQCMRGLQSSPSLSYSYTPSGSTTFTGLQLRSRSSTCAESVENKHSCSADTLSLDQWDRDRRADAMKRFPSNYKSLRKKELQKLCRNLARTILTERKKYGADGNSTSIDGFSAQHNVSVANSTIPDDYSYHRDSGEKDTA